MYVYLRSDSEIDAYTSYRCKGGYTMNRFKCPLAVRGKGKFVGNARIKQDL